MGCVDGMREKKNPVNRRPSLRALVENRVQYLLRLCRSVAGYAWLSIRYRLRMGLTLLCNFGRNGRRQEKVSIRATVINLRERTDRAERVAAELDALGLPAQFHEALRRDPGIVGCALSHEQVLRSWKASPGDLLFVIEDDLVFDASRAQFDEVVAQFSMDESLDVLCVSHVSRGPQVRLGKSLLLSADIQTTAGYLVKPRIVGPLADIFAASADSIISGRPVETHALDILWKRLQRRGYLFAVPAQPIARQGASYSDIQKSFVDYGDI